MAVQPSDAIDLINNCVKKIGYEIIPIESVDKRVIAEDIYAKHSLPKFDTSAMDGYAIIFENFKSNLKVVDTIYAGDNKNIILEQNCCCKIMTGAKIPNNATAIIPVELIVELNENRIKTDSNVRQNQHIRFIGEDIKQEELLIKKHQELNFSHIALLSSQGKSHIKVFKKPKVVIFASGDELKLHYENVENYQIYNSNTPTLIARCKELGCEVVFIGQANDSIDSIKEAILNSLDADLIVTSGGVSVGDADFTKEAFNALNFETIFDGIVIKPGKPTVFGKIDNTYILNLPGNPLACSLIFELFGKIIIRNLQGTKDIYLNTINAHLAQDLPNKKGRETIVPGFFDGEVFTIPEKRSPGMVNTLSHCNSMIVLDKEVESLKKGSKVKILPISWNFFQNEKKNYQTLK